MSEVKEYNGYAGLVKPGTTEVEFIPIHWKDEEEAKNNFLKEIIKTVTEKENGKVTCLGLLPNPINNFTAFVNFDQYDPETKYNFNFFGNPFFGNLLFFKVDLSTENQDIVPIENEDDKIALIDFIKNIKGFEKESGIYKSMIEVNKEEFLEEFLKEQTNVVKESTKHIDEEESEEIKEANKEVEDLINSGKITKEEFENMKSEV